ncbi:hypothetical protein STEG23_025111, partial [Scotinomys teguina]
AILSEKLSMSGTHPGALQGWVLNQKHVSERCILHSGPGKSLSSLQSLDRISAFRCCVSSLAMSFQVDVPLMPFIFLEEMQDASRS